VSLAVVISGGYLRMIGRQKIFYPPHNRVCPTTEGSILSVPHQILHITYNHSFTQTNTSTPINGVASITYSRVAACFLLLLKQSILSRWQYSFLAHDHENGPPLLK
jgi:hypothetical protein